MIEILISYKPFSLYPGIKETKRGLPTHWCELTEKQLIAVPFILRHEYNELKILQIFLKINKRISGQIDTDQRNVINNALKFIAGPEPFEEFIIKRIVRYQAPGAQLEGITFDTFMSGDTYFENWRKGNEYDLFRFIACYYRHPWESGELDEQSIKSRALIIKAGDGPSYSKCRAIAYNYALIREWLLKTCPYLFRRGKSSYNPDLKTEWIDYGNKGWDYLLMAAVNNDKVKYDERKKQPAITVLKYLNDIGKAHFSN